MKKNLLLIFGIILAVFWACSPTTDKEETYAEPVKDITGSWSVVSVVRNGQDITGLVDFSQFRINFLADGTYTFDHYLPFVVSKPGTWSLDDNQYAYKINFVENGQEARNVEFTYPITDGNRQIQISGSPGCPSNTYTYTLEKISQ